MPIDLYWEIEAELKRADYMIASSEDYALINALYDRIYRKVLRFVVSEKDRSWLQEKLQISSGTSGP